MATQITMDNNIGLQAELQKAVTQQMSVAEDTPVPLSPSSPGVSGIISPGERLVNSLNFLPVHGHVDAGTETVKAPATPPSPTSQSPSPPRVKKTRFVQTASQDGKPPTAGTLEPHREGGWGWVVISAAVISNMITGVLALSSPVLIKHMVTTFNGTSTINAAMTIGVSWGAGWILSPIITAMCIKYGARSVCVLGGFVAALGALFTSFAEHLLHMFISFSLIFSFGSAMCDQASRIALRHYFRKTHRGKFRIYHCGQYIGVIGGVYLVDRVIQYAGWRRGLQISTVVVGLNFIIGMFFSKPTRSRKGSDGGRKKLESSPFTFRDYFAVKALKDPCFLRWVVIEAVIALVVRTPLLLMQCDPLTEGSPVHPMLGTHATMIWAAGALVGTFLWRATKRWLPVSPLLFLREQLVLTCVVVMTFGVVTTTDAYFVVAAGLGLVQGGMQATLALQSCRLVVPGHRNFAEAWCACVRGVAMLIGSALPVCLNEVLGQRYPAYIACGAVHALAVIILLVFMGTIRERELDMHAGPQPAPRPPILLEVTPAPTQTAQDNSEIDIDPNKLHVVDEAGLPDCMEHGGNDAATGNGILLGYVGGDQARSADTGDYRWAKIWTDVDAYTGRLLLCRGYDTPEECSEYGHPRKRGYSEPALPVLQECPSQETSSLSRADNSILSLGLKDTDGASSLRIDGCSLVNASYANEDDEIQDATSLRPLPRKMSDNTLFKDKVTKGLVGATASCSRRLSLDSETMNPLTYSFTSRGTVMGEEELRLLENDMNKMNYGTPDRFGTESTVAVPAEDENLVETSV